jgi:Ca2+-dependent lipid-binding protein
MTSGPKPILTPSAQEGKGKCTIEVVAGRDLAIKDKRTASSDPYCVVILGDENYKTSIIERSLNPVW